MVSKKQLQEELFEVTNRLVEKGFDLGGQIGIYDRLKKEDMFLLGRQYQLYKLINAFWGAIT